mmetsp:Transcript_9378/g.15296  ORF Transcript_9378/g.15296 Transcript_9378/m.15296 type:complete len:553 (-) Transcript_9378:1214-2872(-)|eukprot:CAMPEP_0203744196 /NCGR_PEP_ID=MMETSP0098-20131031/354_1 /ASSEMBLY_ACC=CAM_ASM_000208 /TAXON_ID=96639 /ORGANISM=" , Strain NY0313808BC1" /LENGTH=552 /DNA_ID=CAMNT_0050631653 /DNA_START=223 /DNA_END=1881 /DNA_ORIENTATION=+
MLRKLGGVCLVAGGAGLYKYRTDQDFRRSTRLYLEVGPVIGHYRLVQFKQRYFPSWYNDEQDKTNEWEKLDDMYCEQVVELLKELKGMFTKYGQIGAGMQHTLGKTWVEKLRELEDAVPPQPIEVIYTTLEEELGKSPEQVFSYFEETPLGSASIGQVHRAKLVGRDEYCAVKVQYPTSRELFRKDMKSIRGFMEVFAPEQVIILEELERSFEREFDYNIEAQNLETVRNNLISYNNEIKVPKPIRATSRVLIMEYIQGCKLLDGIRAYGRKIAETQGQSFEEFEAKMKKRILDEGMPAKYDGPSQRQIDVYLRTMHLRDSLLNVGVATINCVLTLFSRGTIDYYKTTLPPNAPKIMDTLMRVHGHQLLVDGVFNSDPHAGNFLLMPDDRIGLIDLGATKTLLYEERIAACLLYTALYKRDKEKLMEMVKISGYKSKHMDPDVIWDMCRFGYDTFGQDLLKGRNLQEFMDELYSRDPWAESPDNLVMAQFLSIRLRGVGMAMNYPVSCVQWWGPIAEKELADAGLPYESWDTNMMLQTLGNKTSIAKGATML